VTPPLVSVVVPTKNGMATLPALIDRLRSEPATTPLEIVAVDSGSTDGTLTLLETRADRVISIPAATFDHGLSRNLGIAAATAPLVVLLVQDALPASDDWLERLIDPLLSNPRVAGSWARQAPRPDANPIVRHYMESGQVTSVRARTNRLAGEAELAALSPEERLARCTFDNVCSCIRRSAWALHPFASMPIAEDLAWAREVLLAGFELAYVPDAVVTHSHDRTAHYEYARTRTLHRQLADLFGVTTIPSTRHLWRAIVSSAALHRRLQRRHGGDAVHALALAVAWPLGQFAGARDARLQRRQYRAQGV
jgi:rhamnosyltransferase